MKKFFGFRASKKESVQEDADSPKGKVSRRSSGRPQTAFGRAAFAEEFMGLGEKERDRVKVKSKQNGIATSTAVAQEQRRRERALILPEPNPRLSNPPKHLEGEQVAAGWPAWLTAVAGEAIKAWIPRRADSFEKIDKIGQGTYSNVYKARDLETGKVVALKKVRFDNLEPESVRFMAREIKILRRLDHPNVIKLEGLVTSRMSCSLYLVFEYMEHDLSGLAACPGITFTESQVKCYLQQLLRGLDHCHSSGVIHRDIKGSNLLLDNGGTLKIADFGLATFFQPDQKQQLTTRVVTLWYRPPELLLGATEYGPAIDLWSTGCILGELLAGRPIMPGRTEVEQLHKIFKLCGSPSEEYWKKSKLPHATIFKPQHPYKRSIAETYKDFPRTALDLLDILLAIEPAGRGTASAALKSEFFTSEPFACDPSSLPKYPPSKEFDAKIWDDEARRQRAAGGKNSGSDASRRVGNREHTSKAAAAPDANAELAASLQKRRSKAQVSSKSKSERFNPQKEDPDVGFPIDPPRQIEGGGGGRIYALPPDPAWSGPQPNPNVAGAWGKNQREEDPYMVPSRPVSRPAQSLTVSDFKSQGTYIHQPAADLSRLSTLVAARNNGSGEFRKDKSGARQWERVGGEGLQASRHDQLELVEVSKKNQRITQGLDPFDLQDAMHQDRPGNKGFGGPAERMHFSGPLLPPMANRDDVLDEHERQIQQAVRRARHDKGKNQRKAYAHKTWENGRSEVFELDDSSGPIITSIGVLKTAKSHYSGEIFEIRELEEGLHPVKENYEREQET